MAKVTFWKLTQNLLRKTNLPLILFKKCLETRGNRSEIVWILVLAMTTAKDGASGSNSVREVVARFSLFYKQNGTFWFAKSKKNKLYFQILF